MKKLLLATALATGCGADSPEREILPNLEVPEPPEHGLQVVTPIVRGVVPGVDLEMCTWTDQFADRDLDVRSILGNQTRPGGHHIVVYYTTLTQPPGTSRECEDSDMQSFRYVVASTADGTLVEAPGDLVHQIPKGAQIVVNHHYLNAYDTTVDGQAVVNLNFADADKPYTRSSAVAFVDTGLLVPTGSSEFKVNCQVDRELKLWYLIPHMHRWGTSITVDVTKAGAKTRPISIASWAPEFAFHPPENRYDPAQPYVLSPGDTVDVTCKYDNDSGGPLAFGFEMCVAFAEFVDAGGMGSWACNAGRWGAM